MLGPDNSFLAGCGFLEEVSWGGPPVVPKWGWNRQRFDLAADVLSAEVARLVALGATRLGDRDDGVNLANPDGSELCIRTA